MQYTVPWTHLIKSAPQTASRSVQPFLHSLPVCPTHRQTDSESTLRALFVAIGRIYGPLAGDAAVITFVVLSS